MGSDGAYGSGWRLRLGSEALCGGCSEAEPAYGLLLAGSDGCSGGALRWRLMEWALMALTAPGGD